MKILVANLGSTSFKYRLFDMTDERQLARGGIDRIGQPQSACFVEIGGHRADETRAMCRIMRRRCGCASNSLMNPEFGCLKSADEVAGIGFKAVFAGKLSGIRIVDEELLTAMEALSDIAPAHNPPYVKAMRQLRIGVSADSARRRAGNGVSRNDSAGKPGVCDSVSNGTRSTAFSAGAFTERAIGTSATRIAQLLGRDDLRIISCHLGGSNSLCAMQGRRVAGQQLGMSPQIGTAAQQPRRRFRSVRVAGDHAGHGKVAGTITERPGEQSGLLGTQRPDGDVRDLEEGRRRKGTRSRRTWR